MIEFCDLTGLGARSGEFVSEMTLVPMPNQPAFPSVEFTDGLIGIRRLKRSCFSHARTFARQTQVVKRSSKPQISDDRCLCVSGVNEDAVELCNGLSGECLRLYLQIKQFII